MQKIVEELRTALSLHAQVVQNSFVQMVFVRALPGLAVTVSAKYLFVSNTYLKKLNQHIFFVLYQEDVTLTTIAIIDARPDKNIFAVLLSIYVYAYIFNLQFEK